MSNLGPHNAASHVGVDLTLPVLNWLAAAVLLLEEGRPSSAEPCIYAAEHWVRGSAITLQAAEDAAGGPPEQTGFVVTADELRAVHDYVRVAVEYLSIGKINDCLDATRAAWRRAKVATECLEAAALVNARGHAHVLH